MSEELKCDFCGELDIVWSYPAVSFVYDDVSGSLGDWAACSECSDLIESGDHHKLAKRSLDNAGSWVQGLSHSDYEELLKGIKDVHNKFRANRMGEREPA